MNKTLNGITASGGIAIAKAFCYEETDLHYLTEKITDVISETNRLEQAADLSKTELEAIRDQTEKTFGKDKADIFAAHLLILDDPEFIGAVKAKIKNDFINAEAAVSEIAGQFIEIFEHMDNEYMRERVSDIRDVSKRLLAHLLNKNLRVLSDMTESCIIVAQDLTPSDTAQINRELVMGFVTEIGGRTSHSAIMARSLEIPAVVGVKQLTDTIQNGDLLIIDGENGEVLINPSLNIIDTYLTKKSELEKERERYAALVNEKSVTKDGICVELGANIGSPKDLEGVVKNGAESIGLFRTEFLYMDRDDFPTEEEQFNAYKTVLEGMKDKPVVIRTLDIGGDKKLNYLKMPEEMNPFLGYRAIRLCLDLKEIFRVQLRALLRASIYGNLRIMFPMIAILDELRDAKAMLQKVKKELTEEMIPVNENIQVGMMVEIPAAAVMAKLFATEVDFFSIGTNDLIQYTFAADRMNHQVAYLYQPYHPTILTLIKNVIDAAHEAGKWAGMCGEMAGDSIAIPLLLGLGLDEFSMSASSILKARDEISRLNQTEMKQLVARSLSCKTNREVAETVKAWIK